ncbi:PaaI family thioesterase [Brevibacterium album]|uniref:PaaI family thioesterase n=1 Tax=Brevibacterium album TaxID=417948 RepID=UPI0003FF3216|nr:hotdog fold thioesterase [Brevibacterium album]
MHQLSAVPRVTPESTPEDCARMLAQFAMPAGTLMERMGIELTGLGYDFAEASCPVEGNLQPAGLFHGGGHVVIAETLASMHSAARTGTAVVGVDLNATHLRSITAGTVFARAEVLHGGRRLFSHEVRMTDADDRLLSIVRISNMVLGG